MSYPFRGNDVAADMISAENVEACKAFVEEMMGSYSAMFAEMDQIAATGDEKRFEERFGYMRKPRSPEGRCLVSRGGVTECLLCKACQGVFSEGVELSES